MPDPKPLHRPARDGWEEVSVRRIPEEISRRLQELDLGPRSCRVCVASRLTPDGRFGESWFAAGPERVAVIARNGHPAHVEWTAPLATLKGARTQEVPGGGVLVLDAEGGAREVLRFDTGQAALFGGIAQRLDRHVAPASRKSKEQVKSTDSTRKAAASERPVPFVFDDLLAKERDRHCTECDRPFPKKSKVCPFCVKHTAALWRLLSFAAPFKRELVLMAGLMFLGMLLQLAPPQIVRVMVDYALVSESRGSLLLALIALLGLVMILQQTVSVLHARLGVRVGNSVVTAVQTRTFEHLQLLSLSFYNKRETGALMSRVNNDARQLQGFLVEGVQYTVVNLILAAGVATVLLCMDPFLGFLALAPAPMVVVISIWMLKRVWRRYALCWSSVSALSSLLNNILSGARVVKTFGKEAREVERFNRQAERCRERTIDAEEIWFTVMPIMNLLVQSSLLLVWYFGGLGVYGGKMTLGELFAFVGYLGLLFGPLQLLAHTNGWMSRSLTAAARIFEILDAEPEIRDRPEAKPLDRPKGHLELRGVTFGYEKHQAVLKRLSLKIRPGEMVGLVGASGAGKSTLINLLGRLYEVDEGQILIDGLDLKDIRIADLRKCMGFVLQETFLFSGTVAENIGYARPEASRREIVQAAVAANAHGFIMKLPDGYDTVVGERGGRLSGGERQRIAIARALLLDPKILILDEATSSVDTETEAKIQQALQTLVKGRTTIAIAHRLSTLRHADRLVVMREGEIAEQGSHAELMEMKDGVYRKLVTIQTEWSRTIAVGV